MSEAQAPILNPCAISCVHSLQRDAPQAVLSGLHTSGWRHFYASLHPTQKWAHNLLSFPAVVPRAKHDLEGQTALDPSQDWTLAPPSLCHSWILVVSVYVSACRCVFISSLCQQPFKLVPGKPLPIREFHLSETRTHTTALWFNEKCTCRLEKGSRLVMATQSQWRQSFFFFPPSNQPSSVQWQDMANTISVKNGSFTKAPSVQWTRQV